jgi:predicted RNA binding protein YcfA (HicA-like mRNA interferase family)
MPAPVRFAVVRALLVSKGYRLTRISGAHHIFTKPGQPIAQSVPVHRGMVKYAYLRKAQKAE